MSNKLKTILLTACDCSVQLGYPPLEAAFDYSVYGLTPGDQFRVAFMTQGTRDATSPFIADYNAFVTAQANLNADLAGLGTTWYAIGSTFPVHVQVNTLTNPSNGSHPNLPLYNLAGTQLTPNNSDLWTLGINAPITDQFGALPVLPMQVWTGSVKPSVGELGTSGDIGTGFNLFATNTTWFSFASANSSTLLHPPPPIRYVRCPNSTGSGCYPGTLNLPPTRQHVDGCDYDQAEAIEKSIPTHIR